MTGAHGRAHSAHRNPAAIVSHGESGVAVVVGENDPGGLRPSMLDDVREQFPSGRVKEAIRIGAKPRIPTVELDGDVIRPAAALRSASSRSAAASPACSSTARWSSRQSSATGARIQPAPHQSPERALIAEIPGVLEIVPGRQEVFERAVVEMLCQRSALGARGLRCRSTR